MNSVVIVFLFPILGSVFATTYEQECFWCLSVGGTLTQVNYPQSNELVFHCLRNETHASHMFKLQNTSLIQIKNCTWKDLWTPSEFLFPETKSENTNLLIRWVIETINHSSKDNELFKNRDGIVVLVQLFLILLTQCYVVKQLCKISNCRAKPRTIKPRLCELNSLKGFDEVDA